MDLDAPLAYASLGLPVLPLHSPLDGRCSCGRQDCDSPAKHPLSEHGLKDATTEPGKIREWWTRWPAANVGLALPDDLVVVDIDGADGEVALKVSHYELPDTARAKTGRGMHHFYRTRGKVRPKVGILPHVDLRGPGSYVVAPPSLHVTGTEYRWLRPLDSGLAEAPAWVEAFGRNGRPATVRESSAAVPEGQRNGWLTTRAGAMRRAGMDQGEIEAALLAINKARCAPPLSDAEVRGIAASVSRYAPAKQAEDAPCLVDLDVARLIRDGVPEIVFDLEDFLVPRTLTYLSGSPKGFKTWAALEIAICLATGSSFAGLRARGGHRVLFIEAESALQIPDRFARLCLGHKVNPQSVLKQVRFMVPSRALRLDVERHAEEIRRIARDFAATWIVFDSFVRVHALDENSSADMAALANGALLPLRDEIGCGVLMLDHPPKPFPGGKRGRKEQVRGSWEKLAAADVQIHVASIESNQGRVAELSVAASRVAPERDEPLYLQLRTTINNGIRFEECDPPQLLVTGRPATALDRAVNVIVAERGRGRDLSYSEAVRAVQAAGLSAATGKRAWNSLKEQGSEGSEPILTPDPEAGGSVGVKRVTPPLGGDP